MTKPQPRPFRCDCGLVRLEALGEPILATACDCASCRRAGTLLATLPGAMAITDGDGRTPYVLYRKDRLRCTAGAPLLAEHRLRPDSPTRRVLATCCNSPLFADFTRGHWVSVYRERLPPDRVPVVDRRSPRFVLRLLTAWVQMGFRVPKIGFVQGGAYTIQG